MSYRRIVGQRIRNLRLKKGLTQEGLSEIADLDYRSIGAIERGERNVTLDALSKIAEALGVTVDALFVYDLESIAATSSYLKELIGLMESMTDAEREETIRLLHAVRRVMPSIRQLPGSGRKAFVELIRLVLGPPQ